MFQGEIRAWVEDYGTRENRARLFIRGNEIGGIHSLLFGIILVSYAGLGEKYTKKKCGMDMAACHGV